MADQASPRFHGAQSISGDGATYDPMDADFSRTSSYANKTFGVSQAALSKNETAEEGRDNKRFITSSYATSGYNQADHTYQTMAYSDASHPDAALDKSYALPAPFDSNHSFDTGKKSEYQDKHALIAQTTPKVDPFSAPDALTEKTFADPAMTKVRRDPYAAANGLDVTRLTGLPNRPLTIDEVRDLINHEQVPDLSSKPDAPSKPLNDPNWTPPEAAPPVSDDRPLKPGPTTEDKSDELPSPGMMAQPPAPQSQK